MIKQDGSWSASPLTPFVCDLESLDSTTSSESIKIYSGLAEHAVDELAQLLPLDRVVVVIVMGAVDVVEPFDHPSDRCEDLFIGGRIEAPYLILEGCDDLGWAPPIYDHVAAILLPLSAPPPRWGVPSLTLAALAAPAMRTFSLYFPEGPT
ncbi:hypothetical protein [Nonomuraea sp. NPDC050202]|uniref:hypothetical protein n=1 Tax=Nonomuraea sp. NPDC050202 TaxID=3155035 RepID=UPI0033EDDEA1